MRPWLYAIVRYKVVDAFRARGRRVQVPVEDFAEVLAAPEAPDPTERSDVERVIGRLDPRVGAGSCGRSASTAPASPRPPGRSR